MYFWLNYHQMTTFWVTVGVGVGGGGTNVSLERGREFLWVDLAHLPGEELGGWVERSGALIGCEGDG